MYVSAVCVRVCLCVCVYVFITRIYLMYLMGKQEPYKTTQFTLETQYMAGRYSTLNLMVSMISLVKKNINTNKMLISRNSRSVTIVGIIYWFIYILCIIYQGQ